jgi:plastocyanin
VTESPASDAHRATVTIRRDHAKDARERQVYARVDDGTNHTLMYGDTVTFEVTPGPHRLKSNNTLFWKSVQFSAQPGEHVEFTLINACIWSGMEGLLAFWAGAVPLKLRIERR